MRGHVFWLHCRTIERADVFSFELGANHCANQNTDHILANRYPECDTDKRCPNSKPHRPANVEPPDGGATEST